MRPIPSSRISASSRSDGARAAAAGSRCGRAARGTRGRRRAGSSGVPGGEGLTGGRPWRVRRRSGCRGGGSLPEEAPLIYHNGWPRRRPRREGWLGVDAVRDARGAHARPRPPHARPHVAQPVRGVRRHGAAQGGEPPAHRLVQAARRARQGRPASPPAPAWSPGSAGNHAQSLAYAARARGLGCEVFMPAEASLSKAAAVRGFGGTVLLGGASVDDCVARARERAGGDGRRLRAPVRRRGDRRGAGHARARAARRRPRPRDGRRAGRRRRADRRRRRRRSRRRGPDVRVVGVQARGVLGVSRLARRAARPSRSPRAPTIADGIAIKRPGGLTLPLVAAWVDEFVAVGEDDVADAMVVLLERAKLVVEGAGAVGIAALRTGVGDAGRGGRHGRRALGRQRRRRRAAPASRGATRRRRGGGCGFFTRVDDRPGGLARLLDARRRRRREPRHGQPPARGGAAARARDRRRPRAGDARRGPRRRDRRRAHGRRLRRRALRRQRPRPGAR